MFSEYEYKTTMYFEMSYDLFSDLDLITLLS